MYHRREPMLLSPPWFDFFLVFFSILPFSLFLFSPPPCSNSHLPFNKNTSVVDKLMHGVSLAHVGWWVPLGGAMRQPQNQTTMYKICILSLPPPKEDDGWIGSREGKRGKWPHRGHPCRVQFPPPRTYHHPHRCSNAILAAFGLLYHTRYSYMRVFRHHIYIPYTNTKVPTLPLIPY